MNKTDDVNLEAIRLDGGTQPRGAIDQAYVDELAELLAEGEQLPPVTVNYDGKTYWLVDGFHRHHAHRKAGYGHIECIIRQGTQEDAQWASYAANRDQDAVGLRRTNADKRRAVLAAMTHPLAAKLSDGAIAEHIGVTRQMVGKYRETTSNDCELKRTGKDGRTRDVTNIGKTPRVLASDIGEDEPEKRTTVEVVDTDTGEVIENAEILRTTKTPVSAGRQAERERVAEARERLADEKRMSSDFRVAFTTLRDEFIKERSTDFTGDTSLAAARACVRELAAYVE